METEDRVVEKLKGKNCLIKFIDGEELFIFVDELNGHDPGSWLSDVEEFLSIQGNTQVSPVPGVALNRAQVKYIKKI